MTSLRRSTARDAGITACIALIAALALYGLRWRLFDAHRKVKETADLYVLPPPSSVVKLSLGYRAALADYLWADTLVQQGLRVAERRRYDHLLLYIETINELDPSLRDPYLLVDALVTFQFGETPHWELVKTRQILERGAREHPLDGEIWLNLGQFVTFIGPGGYLTDPAEIEAWRAEGARYLARAAELSGDQSNIAWQALAGATILNRKGERDASIRFLKRTLAVTEDDELRNDLLRRLEALLGEEQIDTQRQREEEFRRVWGDSFRFVSRTALLVLGPQPDVGRCAGEAGAKLRTCARTWNQRFHEMSPSP